MFELIFISDIWGFSSRLFRKIENLLSLILKKLIRYDSFRSFAYHPDMLWSSPIRSRSSANESGPCMNWPIETVRPWATHGALFASQNGCAMRLTHIERPKLRSHKDLSEACGSYTADGFCLRPLFYFFSHWTTSHMQGFGTNDKMPSCSVSWPSTQKFPKNATEKNTLTTEIVGLRALFLGKRSSKCAPYGCYPLHWLEERSYMKYLFLAWCKVQ